jgi:hypothetical protein
MTVPQDESGYSRRFIVRHTDRRQIEPVEREEGVVVERATIVAAASVGVLEVTEWGGFQFQESRWEPTKQMSSTEGNPAVVEPRRLAAP